MIEIKNISKNSNEVIMQMTEAGDILGEAKATVNKNCAMVEHIDCTVDFLRLDLGKALLNALDLLFIEDVYCHKEKLDKILTMLRFTKKDGKMHVNLSGYFTVGNNCVK